VEHADAIASEQVLKARHTIVLGSVGPFPLEIERYDLNTLFPQERSERAVLGKEDVRCEFLKRSDQFEKAPLGAVESGSAIDDQSIPGRVS
jgi:hypothetical protein